MSYRGNSPTAPGILAKGNAKLNRHGDLVHSVLEMDRRPDTLSVEMDREPWEIWCTQCRGGQGALVHSV